MTRPGAPPALRTAGLLGLLALVSLLTQPGAALPRNAYFFRDLSLAFYPFRAFAAQELREGRLPVWNPYAFEGTFALPYFHLLDLGHLAFPGPAAFSFLLALQFPLAALAMYALLRDREVGRAGAFAAGALYALGGLAQSSANLYVFLQALAAAPLVVLTLRRAASGGRRALAAAALAIALGLTTLAVEFVGQAVLLGTALALAEHPRLVAAGRLLGASLLGTGLAGVAVLPLLGLLPDTVRGAGLDPSVSLGHATPPLALLQVVLPHLFGHPADPVQVFWGGHFFPKLPYFVSLYLGAVVLALAVAGLARMPRRASLVLLVLALLGLWFALGEAGGLAPRVLAVFPFVRYPSKAQLLPYLAAVVLAGFGVDALRQGAGWGLFGRAASLLGALLLLPVALLIVAPEAVRTFAHLEPLTFPAVRTDVLLSAATAAALALATAALAWAVRAGRADAPRSALLLVGVAIADLARVHSGMNPQVDPAFFDLVPELRAERLFDLEGGRVFSYPLETSPAFLRYLGTSPPGLRLSAFYVSRQLAAPFTNVIDRIRLPGDRELTSFTPRPPDLRSEEYRVSNVGALLPWMRNAAVARVLSLDELRHPDLALRRLVAAGPPGLFIHVYEVARPAPFATLACAVRVAPDREEAAAVAQQATFDPALEVVLEQDAEGRCREGAVRPQSFLPAERRYATRGDGPGLLVERENFARGWRAFVDGRASPVLRANGKHRAVAVPAGEHEVVLRYEAPGLWAGLLVSLLSLAAVGTLLIWPPAAGRRP